MDYNTHALIKLVHEIELLEKETNVLSLIANESLGISFKSDEMNLIRKYKGLKQNVVLLEQEVKKG